MLFLPRRILSLCAQPKFSFGNLMYAMLLHVKLGPLNFRLRLSDLLADLTINLYRCISIQITNLLYFLLSSDCRMYPGVILCWVHQLDGSPRFVCDSLVTADRFMRQIRRCQFFPLWSKKCSSWPLSRAAIDYFAQQKNSWYLRLLA